MFEALCSFVLDVLARIQVHLRQNLQEVAGVINPLPVL